MLCLLLVEIIVYKYTHKLIFIDSLKHFWVYLVTVCNTKSYQVYPKKLYMFMYLNFQVCSSRSEQFGWTTQDVHSIFFFRPRATYTDLQLIIDVPYVLYYTSICMSFTEEGPAPVRQSGRGLDEDRPLPQPSRAPEDLRTQEGGG